MAGHPLLDGRLFHVLLRAEELLVRHAGPGTGVRYHEHRLRHHPDPGGHHLRRVQVPERVHRRPLQRPLAPGHRPHCLRRPELPLRMERPPLLPRHRAGRRTGFRRDDGRHHGRPAGAEQHLPGVRLPAVQPAHQPLVRPAGTGDENGHLEHLALDRRRHPGRPLRLPHRHDGRLADLLLGARRHRRGRYLLHHRDPAGHPVLGRAAGTAGHPDRTGPG